MEVTVKIPDGDYCGGERMEINSKELVKRLRRYANDYSKGRSLGRYIQGTAELLLSAADYIEKKENKKMNLDQYKEKMFSERPDAKEEYEKLVDHDFVKEIGERVAAGIEDSMKLQEAVKEIGMERLLELVEADREGRCVVFPW